MRILHVEDDDDTRTLVAFILDGEGWQVVSVDNAASATTTGRDGAVIATRARAGPGLPRGCGRSR